MAKLAKIAQVQNDQERIAVRQLGDEEDCDEDGGVDDDHDDDGDDDDISTGDCGYKKRLTVLKIFCNILHGPKKIVNFFQTQIQSATWSKYTLKIRKNPKF